MKYYPYNITKIHEIFSNQICLRANVNIVKNKICLKKMSPGLDAFIVPLLSPPYRYYRRWGLGTGDIKKKKNLKFKKKLF